MQILDRQNDAEPYVGKPFMIFINVRVNVP